MLKVGDKVKVNKKYHDSKLEIGSIGKVIEINFCSVGGILLDIDKQRLGFWEKDLILLTNKNYITNNPKNKLRKKCY